MQRFCTALFPLVNERYNAFKPLKLSQGVFNGRLASAAKDLLNDSYFPVCRQLTVEQNEQADTAI